MKTRLSSEPRFSSPLERDLAVSDVRLLALKTLAGELLSSQDLTAVSLLRDSLRHSMDELHSRTQIPADLVPQEDMREQLELTLGTLPHPPSSDRSQLPPESLQGILRLLDRFLAANSLSRTNARKLLKLLLEFDRTEQPQDTALGLHALRGLNGHTP